MTAKADVRHMGMAVDYATIEYKRLLITRECLRSNVLSLATAKAAGVIKVDPIELHKLMIARIAESN